MKILGHILKILHSSPLHPFPKLVCCHKGSKPSTYKVGQQLGTSIYKLCVNHLLLQKQKSGFFVWICSPTLDPHDISRFLVEWGWIETTFSNNKTIKLRCRLLRHKRDLVLFRTNYLLDSINVNWRGKRMLSWFTQFSLSAVTYPLR